MAPKSPAKAGEGDEQRAKRAKILEIQRDSCLTDEEKGKRIQALHGASQWLAQTAPGEDPLGKLTDAERDSVTCGICTSIVDKPVTLTCQHNMCLSCLKSIRKLEATLRRCPYCRTTIKSDFIDGARINTAFVSHLRMLLAKSNGGTAVVTARVHREEAEEEEEQRPEEAFITSRAVRNGLANACSGSLKMTCPPDHFGPIGPEFDPRRNRGLVVGDLFPNRMACRMWNAHLPHVAGIAGQSNKGAQSVVLSGGYEDDVDEGDYFLYTGSGGKDLSGNKRNGAHDKDQEFTRYNLALKKSCEEGLPVRVIRSRKEKRSAFAPKDEALRELQQLMTAGGGSGGGKNATASVASAMTSPKKEQRGGAGGGKRSKSTATAATAGRKAGVNVKARKVEEEENEDDEDEDGSEDEGEGSSEEEEMDGEDEEEEEDEGEEGGKKSKAAARAVGTSSPSSTVQVAEAKAFAPVRYDGIYRVLACWRSKGAADYLVCRYLFVRCDNAPAPWSSAECGDKPGKEIPDLAAKEIAAATKLGEEITYMTEIPAWDYDAVKGEWGWTRAPPSTQTKTGGPAKSSQEKSLEKQLEALQRELKRMTKHLVESYSCSMCHQVAQGPVYTPCTHVFCRDCLKGKLEAADGPARHNSRPSRTSSQRKPCPARGCGKDLTAFMKELQVNNTMASQAASAAEAIQQKEAEVAAMKRRMEGKEEPKEELRQVQEEEEGKEDVTAAELVQKDEGKGDQQEQQEEEPAFQEGEREEPGGVVKAGGAAAAAAVGAAVLQASPPAGAVLATAGATGGGDCGGCVRRWYAEATCIAGRHPNFDVELIAGLLEDQGGDVTEVEAYIKSIKRSQQQQQQQKAVKSPRRRTAGTSKRGRSRRSKLSTAGDAVVIGDEVIQDGEEEDGKEEKEAVDAMEVDVGKKDNQVVVMVVAEKRKREGRKEANGRRASGKGGRKMSAMVEGDDTGAGGGGPGSAKRRKVVA